MTVLGVVTISLVFTVLFFVILFLCGRYAGGGMKILGGDFGQKLAQLTKQGDSMIYWYAGAAVNFAFCVIVLIYICRQERQVETRRNEERLQRGLRPEREEFVQIQDVRMRNERGFTGAFAPFQNASRYVVGL